ncbi:MAG: lipoprotein signal peptidase [Bacteroidia bacterium]|nr:lipoprotein signal peptidase [Bacteroidia bacterium]
MKYYKYFLLTLGIIVLDQTVKLLVHFNMEMGQFGQIVVFDDWFKIHYILNPGMAFGLKLDTTYGKLVLSLFRILATLGIAYYIKVLIDKKAHPGLVWCVALILGGAIGNVIDSTFYGVFLSNAPEGSITPWFHGQVIDMFYIDIWEGELPRWIPLVGGDYYSFWPIFNIADASIFVGVTIILIFQRSFSAKCRRLRQVAEENYSSGPIVSPGNSDSADEVNR